MYTFSEFDLDASRFELRRNGRVLKLERIPMELLILLLEKDGNVATRQEIIDRLWGKDVFVDTEHGINTAIRKVRQVLRDDPDQPRFVQTVTGKGYRFVALIEKENPNAAPSLQDASASQPSPQQAAAPPGRRDLWWLTALVATVLLAVAGTVVFNLAGFRDRVFAAHSVGPIHSMAVLPLANLSGDSSQDYFADGMTDELITALAQNHSLRVISRTSTMQYKAVNKPLREIAQSLGVDGILEGSVSRSGDRVHVNLQLIYAPTDTHIWAQSFDRNLSTAMSLPDELSQTIASEAKVDAAPPKPAKTINPEAHDAYLRGRYFWFTFNVANTLPYFEKAIRLQPDYAAAWSGLADTYALEGMTDRSPLEVTDKAHTAALKALELDPSLAEAHHSMAGWYLFYAWDPARAEIELRRALELDPNSAEAHHLLSYILETQHRYSEGESEAKRSVELDPFIHPWELGAFYIGERKFDDAISELKMQILAHPQDSDIANTISKAYWLKGMYKESQAEMERALSIQGDLTREAAAHKAWVTGGERAVERWGVANIKATAHKQYFETEFVASIIAFTGDKDETMKYLEASYRNHDPDLIFIQDEPLFDFLHSDPRYQALVRKMGLPLAQ